MSQAAQEGLPEPESPPRVQRCAVFSGAAQQLRTQGYAVVPHVYGAAYVELLRRVSCRGSGPSKLWSCSQHHRRCWQECISLVEELCDPEDPDDHDSFVQGWWGI